MQFPRSQAYDDSSTLTSEVNVVMSQVYLLMTIGLMITAVVAAVIAGNPQWMQSIFGASPFLIIGLFIAQIVLVIALTAAINKLSPALATTMFVLYSALNGVTLSVIFWVYTDASIVSTFMITAATFGVMSFIGFVTKRDLTKLGSWRGHVAISSFSTGAANSVQGVNENAMEWQVVEFMESHRTIQTTSTPVVSRLWGLLRLPRIRGGGGWNMP